MRQASDDFMAGSQRGLRTSDARVNAKRVPTRPRAHYIAHERTSLLAQLNVFLFAIVAIWILTPGVASFLGFSGLLALVGLWFMTSDLPRLFRAVAHNAWIVLWLVFLSVLNYPYGWALGDVPFLTLALGTSFFALSAIAFRYGSHRNAGRRHVRPGSGIRWQKESQARRFDESHDRQARSRGLYER